jgi:hypothetical protein
MVTLHGCMGVFPGRRAGYKQGILMGKYHCTVDLLFDWFGLVCFANKYTNCQLSYSWFQASQTGGQLYSDTSLPPLVLFPDTSVGRCSSIQLNSWILIEKPWGSKVGRKSVLMIAQILLIFIYLEMYFLLLNPSCTFLMISQTKIDKYDMVKKYRPGACTTKLFTNLIYRLL